MYCVVCDMWCVVCVDVSFHWYSDALLRVFVVGLRYCWCVVLPWCCMGVTLCCYVDTWIRVARLRWYCVAMLM